MSAGWWWRRAHGALSIGIAVLLGFQALALLLAGRQAFLRLGYPDGARIALGVLEAAAAALTAVPGTFVVGAVGLVAVLAWAAGFHFALHARTWPLHADLAVLALLLAVRPFGARREEDAA